VRPLRGPGVGAGAGVSAVRRRAAAAPRASAPLVEPGGDPRPDLGLGLLADDHLHVAVVGGVARGARQQDELAVGGSGLVEEGAAALGRVVRVVGGGERQQRRVDAVQAVPVFEVATPGRGSGGGTCA
jgi:hypothetical protein